MHSVKFVFLSLLFSCTLFSCTEKNTSELIPLNYSTLELKHVFGKGIGYSCGYTSLVNTNYVIKSLNTYIVDLRSHVFDDDSTAFNVGLAYRHFFPTSEIEIGLNTYFDGLRPADSGFIGQVGLGFEFFHPLSNVNLNIYLPTKDEVKTFDISYDNYFGFFWIYHEHTNISFKCFDVDACFYRQNFKYATLTTSAGFYYIYNRVDEPTWGSQYNSTLKFYKWATLSLMFTNDNIFDSRFQVQISFEIPLYTPNKRKNRLDIEPVQRHEILAIQNHPFWDWSY
ncbi:MAG: hypothetical protein JHC93_01575 [Parachlamydiales bacterium]|nr:hypothetical protein [Parachlamydiales bacterium]